jgi:hypothetical protein
LNKSHRTNAKPQIGVRFEPRLQGKLVLEHDTRYRAIAAVIQMVVLRATMSVDEIKKEELPNLFKKLNIVSKHCQD